MHFEIREYSSEAAFQAKEPVVSLYQDVYSLPPYSETEAGVRKFAESWRGRTEKPGFLFIGAADPNGKLVGFSYGWRSVPGDTWNTRLSQELGSLGPKWLDDCFEFADLAVAPATQGHGLGRDLTKALFSRASARTAILLTHQSTTIASQMYSRNGWVVLKGSFEAAPGKHYSIMGKELRP